MISSNFQFIFSPSKFSIINKKNYLLYSEKFLRNEFTIIILRLYSCSWYMIWWSYDNIIQFLETFVIISKYDQW